MPAPVGLYEAIAHGDAEHRGWLREALDAFFDGRRVPEPRGKGVEKPAGDPTMQPHPQPIKDD